MFKRLPIATAVAMSFIAYAHAQTTVAPVVDLGQLTVTADRQGTKVQTNVVTLQAKDESTATDMRGLLKSEPSISMGGGNGASQYWTIRGMGQNSIDLKIDNGHSDTQTLYHQGRFTLDPSLVKIVSVQKGAGSASAGIGATNGAIVAKTLDAAELLKGSNEDIGAKVNVGYASNNEHSYGASIFGHSHNIDVLVSTNHTNQGDYRPGKGYVSPVQDSADTTKVHYSALKKSNYLIKAGVNLNNHRLVLSHLNDSNEGVRHIREEYDWYDRQFPRHRKLTLQNTNLEWIANDLGVANRIDANVYRQKTTRDSADDENTGYAGNRTGQNITYSTTTGANINVDTNINDENLIKYGVNYRKQGVTPNFMIDGVVPQEKTDAAAYVEAINNSVDDLTLTAGLRYDHFNFKAMDGKKINKGTLNPSFAAIYQVMPELSLSASHNWATRSPRMVDNLLAHGRRGIISVDDNLKPEQARSSEVGFNYTSGGFAANGSYFWQKINNLSNSGSMARHGGATKYTSGILNAGHATNQGYELNASYQVNSITARVGVAKNDPKFYISQEALDITKAAQEEAQKANPSAKIRPPTFQHSSYAQRIGRTWTAGLAYRFADPNLEIGINHRIVEQAYNSSVEVAQGNATLTPRPGFNVTDVYANWKPYNDDRVNVNFAINNVADKLYREHAQSARADRPSLPGVGRDVRIGINYKF